MKSALTVWEPCQPYPVPDNAGHPELRQDFRNTQYLTKVIEGLSERELREMARTLLLLYPQRAEQELLFIGRRRCAEQRSDLELAKDQHQ